MKVEKIITQTSAYANNIDLPLTHAEASEELGSNSLTQSFYAQVSQIWSGVVLPFVAIRILLVLVGLVTTYYLLPLINLQQPIHPTGDVTHFPGMLWWMGSHFDSGFYLDIAYRGYGGVEALHGMSNWAFFPLFPILIYISASPFGRDYNA